MVYIPLSSCCVENVLFDWGKQPTIRPRTLRAKDKRCQLQHTQHTAFFQLAKRDNLRHRGDGGRGVVTITSAIDMDRCPRIPRMRGWNDILGLHRPGWVSQGQHQLLSPSSPSCCNAKPNACDVIIMDIQGGNRMLRMQWA